MKTKLVRGLLTAIAVVWAACPLKTFASDYDEVGQYGRPGYIMDTQEQIDEEIRLGELEELAQLVEAEAGNQDFYGKVMVADVVLNRVDSEYFPDNIHDVIFQSGQFSVTKNGAWEKAAWNMQDSDYAAVEYAISLRENKDILYFNNCSQVAGGGTPFKHGDHWFNTQT